MCMMNKIPPFLLFSKYTFLPLSKIFLIQFHFDRYLGLWQEASDMAPSDPCLPVLILLCKYSS